MSLEGGSRTPEEIVSRLVAKHLGKYIPGNPNVVVENMDGAGSLIGLNHVYNVAKPLLERAYPGSPGYRVVELPAPAPVAA